jgi:hypothetical protein
MPVISTTNAVLTLATLANSIAGSAFEFARVPELLNIGVTQSATGGFCTITNGSDIVAEEFEPYIATTYAIIPDQMYFTDYSAVGDRLVIKYRNPSAGTLTVRTLVQISQAA